MLDGYNGFKDCVFLVRFIVAWKFCYNYIAFCLVILHIVLRCNHINYLFIKNFYVMKLQRLFLVNLSYAWEQR